MTLKNINPLKVWFSVAGKAKIYAGIILLLFLQSDAISQNIAQVDSGTTGSPSAGPINRSSATSTNNFNNFVYLYTSSELNIPSGAVIFRLDWEAEANTGGLSGSNYFRIDMQNSTQTAVSSTSTWNTEVAGAKLVYANSSYTIPAGGGWISHILDSGFTYTGGNLKVLTDHVKNGTATGAIDWYYETVTGFAGGISGTSSRQSTAFTATYSNKRPNLRIYYLMPGVDATPESVFSPAIIMAPSSTVSVGAKFFNWGQDTITSINFSYQLNNGSVVTEAWTGTLLAGKSINYTFTNQLTLPSSRPADLKIWVDDANGLGPDINTLNDTLFIALCLALDGGNYTVGSDPSDDFASLSEAADVLRCGVLGPINILVKEGVYSGPVVFTTIPGASATNYIKITGEKQKTTIIEHSPTVSAERTAIDFTDVKHLTLDSLTIDVSNGAYGWGIHFNTGNDSIVIKNNIIITDVTATTGYDGIIASASATSNTTAGNTVNNLQILNNTIIGGAYGIRLNGTSSTAQITGIEILGNRVLNSYTAGIFLSSVSAPRVENNIVDLRVTGASTSEGINLTNAAAPFTVLKNKITNPGQYGINISGSVGSSSSISLIANNMIGGGFRNTSTLSSGIRIQGTANYINIYYNSVNLDMGDGAALNVRTTTVTNLDIRNNSFAYTGSSTAGGYAMYLSSTTAGQASRGLNYNNYYSTGGKFTYYGADKATLTTLRAVNSPTGNDVNSISLNPGYASALDLRLISPNLVGKATPISGVTTDFYGNTRSTTTPVIGAHEFVPVPNDLGAVAVVTPKVACPSSSAESIAVSIYNFGTNTQSGFPVAYRINGGSIVRETFTGSLAPNVTQTFTFATTANLTATGPYTIEIWSELSTDARLSNDTVKYLFYNALHGQYTIGGTSPDYATINDAVTDLKLRGVCSAVTFLIRPGTYAERMVIPEILNASSTNTVTFLGANQKTSIISNSTTVSADRSAIVLNGAKYIIIDSLTIDVSGSTYGWGVHLTGAAEFNTIRNNRIITGATGTSANHAGIVASVSPTGTTGGNAAHNITIENNSISGGYYGIGLFGVTAAKLNGFVVKNNLIEDYYYYGIYFSQVAAPVATGNTILHRATGSIYASGINLAGPGPFNFSSNRIIGAGQNGIFVGNSAISGSVRSLIANNMVGGGFKNEVPEASGIRIITSSEIDVYFNSVNMDANGGSAFYVGTGSANINVKNNSFAYTGSAPGYAINVQTPANLISNDYNNYYNTSSLFVFYGAARANLADLQAVNTPAGNDVNSIVGNPFYKSALDLSVTRVRLNGKGTPVSGITTDIFGTTRNATAPAIGAHEFVPLATDAGITALLAPVSGCGLTNADSVKIEIFNYGANTLTSIPVGYRVNGGTVVNATVSVNLTINALANYTFTVPAPMNGVGPFNFEIWTNLSGDMLGSNDTIRVSVSKALVGSYTIGGTSPDFATFSDAAAHLALVGVCGPAVLNVRAGVYNERVVIDSIPGTSATNTVTFKGADPVTTILKHTTTVSAERSVLTIRNAEYVIIDSLTIDARQTGTGTSYGWGVQVMSGSSNTIIRNNIILTDSTTTSTSWAGIVVSNSETSVSTGASLSNVLIENNEISGGYYGISVYGISATKPTGYISGLLIKNNMIRNSYLYSTYINYTKSAVISGNDISSRAGTQASYGIYLYESSGGFRISANRIYNITAYGIQVSYATATAADPSFIINNMIGGGFTEKATTIAGIRLYSSTASPTQYLKIKHNTVNFDATTGGALMINATVTGINNIEIVNNNFAATGKQNAYVINISPAAIPAIVKQDFNNYYSNGVNFVIYTDTLPDLPALKAINIPAGNDSNSISIRPFFNSNIDLGLKSPDFYGKGTAAPDVPVDFFGEPRHPTKPTIGAQEFLPLDNDIAIIDILSPGVFDCGDSLHTVTVVVKNMGLNTQTAIPVNFDITGSITASQTEYVPGPLSFSEADTFTFAARINAKSGGSIILKAYSGLATDDNHSNDTLIINSEIGVKAITPTVIFDTVCLRSNAALVATSGNGTRIWYADADGGFALASGDTFKIAKVLTSASYYVENANVSTSVYHIGPPDTSIGTKSTAFFSDAEVFNAYRSLLIDSVKLITDVAGTITIGLRDADDNIIARKTLSLTVGNRNYHLGFYVPPGTEYKLTMLSGTTGVLLWRNTMGAAYPYDIPGLMSITRTTYTSQDRYYFFYDLQVRPYCASERVEVKAIAATLPVYSNIAPGEIFQGTYRAGGVNNIDQVCAGDTLIYDIIPPVLYDNGNYGTQWSVSQSSVKTINGTVAANSSFATPAAGNNAALTFIPSMTEGDSIFVLSVTFTQAGGCDTTLLRYIYVSPKPLASFTAQNVCAGDAMAFTNTSVTGGHNISFSWNFGDGNTSAQKDPVHLYALPGDYEVTLIASAVSGCPDTSKLIVHVYEVPAASFTSTGSCSNQPVVFTNSSTAIPSATYKWYFGDGDSSTAKDPSHLFKNAGTFNVVLWITQNGCSDSTGSMVTVLPSPVASFIANNVCFGEAVQFNNQTTLSSGVLTYTWNFGDTDTSTAVNPLHTYSVAGNYMVSLYATANSGCTDTFSAPVSVFALPDNGFSFIAGNNGEIYFTADAASQGNYIWDFGDGNKGMGQSVMHKYAASATYSVSLKVTGMQGCTDSSAQNVQVLNVSSGPVVTKDNVIKVFPNPYEDVTTIAYSLDQSAEVSLNVYDLNGKLIETVYSGKQTSGTYEYSFGHDRPSGVYIVKLMTGSELYISRIVKLN